MVDEVGRVSARTLGAAVVVVQADGDGVDAPEVVAGELGGGAAVGEHDGRQWQAAQRGVVVVERPNVAPGGVDNLVSQAVGLVIVEGDSL